MSLAAKERQALARSFLEYGPDAPTLCAGWKARDLLEHLIARERNPLSITPVGKWYAKRVKKELQTQDFADLVALWQNRCYPRYSPRKFFDAQINGVEHWVHHEDLRRGQGLAPRELDEETAQYLAKSLQMMRVLVRSPRPVYLEPLGFGRIEAQRRRGVVAQGDDVVHVRGEVGEVLLWAFGRPSEVAVIGDTQGLHIQIL